MNERDRDAHRMAEGLLRLSHLMSPEEVPDRVAEHGRMVGFDDVRVYLADLRGRFLRPLPGPRGRDAGPDDRVEVRVEGTAAGWAFQYGRVTRPGRGGRYWWVPLIDGTDRLGLLRVSARGDADDVAVRDMNTLASVVALLVAAKRAQSDAFARLTRTQPMSTAAEMQWNLIPSPSYADARVVIAAAMEPAYSVSGDAYDYALDGDAVHLALFDAMGHDTAAGLTANLAVGAGRSARRAGAGLAGITDRIEEALVEQYGGERFVTGVLALLDARTGTLTWVNRGHHPPLVIRAGRWVTRLRCAPSHPLGLALGLPVTTCRGQLQPGDRIVLYTDGITEARRAGGREFGLERFIDFLVRHHADGLPVPETLRRLVHAVMDHHDGRIDDDASVLLCEWLGPSPSWEGAAALAGLPMGGGPATPAPGDPPPDGS